VKGIIPLPIRFGKDSDFRILHPKDPKPPEIRQNQKKLPVAVSSLHDIIRAMRWVRDYTPQPDIARFYRQAIWVTLGGNLLLAVSKAIVAAISGSVALYADAANSVSDVVYSLFMVLGLWMAQRPPDLSHPQGHSRFEPLVGMVVTFSMTFAGFEAARASLERLTIGGLAVEPGLPSLVLFFSAAIKVFMFFYIRGIAKKIGSPTLATTAKDNLSDVLTSMAALVGAFGSLYIHPLTDPIAGLAVSAWIFRAAFNAGRENLGYLTGAGATQELREEIVKVAEQVPGVLRVHHTMTEYVGPRLMIDLHINVNGEMTVKQAHVIADQVAERLQALPKIDRAYVHIEPHDWEE
jgi:cation diffusion facilitator family transporter